MKKFKKIVALATAMTLAMAPTVVSAAATTSTGASVTGGAVSNGKFEGWIDMNVFSYELPTQADDSLEFIVDPQNLIDKSNDANSTGAVTAGAVGVYFENNSAYAASSDALVVKNYSSMDVDVSIAAKVTITSADSVKLVTAGAVTKDIATESSDLDLCIAINQATTDAVEYVDNTSKSATLTATMAALDADNFEVTDDGNGGYKYQAKSGTTDVEIAEFYFTGSCNTAADWSAAKDMKAKLEVVWTVARDTDMPTVTASNNTLTWDRTKSMTFAVDLGSFNATSIHDIGTYYDGTVFDYAGSWNGYSALSTYDLVAVNGNQITLNPGLATYCAAGDSLYVRFNSATGDTATLKIN